MVLTFQKKPFDVAIYQNDSFRLGLFSNDAIGFKKLAKWLKKHKVSNAPACIEATGRYGQALALFLHEATYPVSIVNPARIKAYSDSRLSRIKTDPQDARTIAHFCATQKPRLWTPPPPEVMELQMLTRRLENLKTMRTQESNRVQSGISSMHVLADITDHIAYLAIAQDLL